MSLKTTNTTSAYDRMYFKKLNLKQVEQVKRPSCLPEEKDSDSKMLDLNDYKDEGYDEHSYYKGRRRKKDETFEVIIPLGDDKMKPNEIRRALKSEYAARYLEKLGASPTPQNLQIIWKFMPLEKCKIQQVFHPELSKNDKKNYISIKPNFSNRKLLKEELDLDELNTLPATVQLPGLDKSTHEAGEAEDKMKKVSKFEEYKNKFIYPYNLPVRYDPQTTKLKSSFPFPFAKKHVEQEAPKEAVQENMYDKVVASLLKSTQVEDEPAPMLDTSSKLHTSSTMRVEREYKQEIEKVPTFSVGETREHCSHFLAEFPFKEHWADDPTLDKKLAKLHSEVRGNTFLTFVKELAEFLYWSCVAPSNAETLRLRYDKDRGFLSLYDQALDLLDSYKTKEHHRFLLPTVILCVRVCLDATFTTKFPLWCASAQGKQAMRRVDALALLMLDPLNYLSHLSTLESSPQVLKILHKKRKPTRVSLTSTSPITRFIIGNPQSKEAKCILSHNKYVDEEVDLLSSVVDPIIRNELLAVMARRKFGVAVDPRSISRATGSTPPAAADAAFSLSDMRFEE